MQIGYHAHALSVTIVVNKPSMSVCEGHWDRKRYESTQT